MLIPSSTIIYMFSTSSLSRRVNANSQQEANRIAAESKLIKKGEC